MKDLTNVFFISDLIFLLSTQFTTDIEHFMYCYNSCFIIQCNCCTSSSNNNMFSCLVQIILYWQVCLLSIASKISDSLWCVEHSRKINIVPRSRACVKTRYNVRASRTCISGNPGNTELGIVVEGGAAQYKVT